MQFTGCEYGNACVIRYALDKNILFLLEWPTVYSLYCVFNMSGQKESIVLYTNHDSSPTWRVRIALALKGLQFERKYFRFHESVEPAYYEVNPLGQIPAVEIDGDIITQSLAIIDYLDEKYPQPKLLPSDLKKRAKAREISEIVNSGIQPPCNFYFYHYDDNIDEYTKQCKNTVEKGFVAIEKILEKVAGKFCIGNEITIADVCLAPQVYRAIGFGVNIALFPKISEIWKQLCTVDAVRSTHPDNEPDCPKAKTK
ncbi:maleylacetoacetate isomerase-like [Dendronephthya gigantea]|uniref:maleylacetoacetate isomerase-like n=1 Tax=Dendronephthya gigantea TaxID=151771 RepID=UPI001068E87B|nr:maleylacetoacetate isomerase-like [Dendronephthya gigantea]